MNFSCSEWSVFPLMWEVYATANHQLTVRCCCLPGHPTLSKGRRSCEDGSVIWRILLSWVQIRPSGLQQDAVIEIMIALLGVMIAVLAIILAIVGVYGYQSIKEEAAKRAAEAADLAAAKRAEEVANERMAEFIAVRQAGDLSGDFADERQMVPELKASAKRKVGKKKATSDKALERD